jgi:hypothetical protein
MPAPSQKFRPITFDLSGGPVTAFADMVIRPEELIWTEPTQITVHNTLAGAWADAFDRGVATIRLAGHTGWREEGGGGEAQFHHLRQSVFQGWNDSRAALVAGGQDPAAVELIFTDDLDQREALVAPKSFTLKRSKARPLLMMFNIELIVLADAGQPTGIRQDPIAQALGAFQQGADLIDALADELEAMFDDEGVLDLGGLFF